MGKKKAKPVTPKRPAVTHGGKRIEIPLLSGPVGPVVAALQTKFPKWNEPADVEIVSYYFSVLADAEVVDQADGTRQAGHGHIETAAEAAKAWATNLNKAIANFQTAFGVSDAVESANKIILPDGPTLKSLVDYGDDAEKLLELSWDKKPKNYLFVGHFDLEVFINGYKTEFGKEGHYDATKESQLRQLLNFMANDPRMIDIRWIAYVLATVYKEAETPSRAGWLAQWFPVNEVGKGVSLKKDYARPVKVEKVGDGAKITEWDGDQFSVDANGKMKALTKGAGTGAAYSATVSPTYTKAAGSELAYYGRGYVQLTWWNNYATAGIPLSRGLELLFDPEVSLDPSVAYKLMSYCLLTGFGFANGRKLSDYLYGSTTNYTKARHMVNGNDSAGEIAANAVRFEKLLLAARI